MNTPTVQNIVYEYRYSMINMNREDVPQMSKLNLLRSKLPVNEHKSCIIDDTFGRAGAIIAIGMITYALSLLF